MTSTEPPENSNLPTGVGTGLGIAIGVALGAAVWVEQHQPNRHQLHHLARIVLVGLAAGGGVFLLVATGVEVVAHGGVQRHVSFAIHRSGVRARGEF